MYQKFYWKKKKNPEKKINKTKKPQSGTIIYLYTTGEGEKKARLQTFTHA